MGEQTRERLGRTEITICDAVSIEMLFRIREGRLAGYFLVDWKYQRKVVLIWDKHSYWHLENILSLDPAAVQAVEIDPANANSYTKAQGNV